jgi:hypothetical protein
MQGEGVTVDISKFYNSPPDDLTIFFPTPDGFDNTKPWNVNTDVIVGETGIRGKIASRLGRGRDFHDYRSGMPNAWNTGAFTTYFQAVSGPSDVRRLARITAQSWGGWLIGVPIGAMMY